MGSEPGAGWTFARAAAAGNEVWVITRPRFEPLIADALASDPALAERIHPVYLDLPAWCLRLKRHHRDVYWYYPLWQWLLGRKALELHRAVKFNVAHHITFASDWMPCGLTALPPSVPLVWGPVGGASYVPAQLLRWLGVRGAFVEFGRRATTGTYRRLFAHRIARRARLTVALNDDVGQRFAGLTTVVVEPNAAIDRPSVATTRSMGTSAAMRTAVFVGRLMSWKGTRLALEALCDESVKHWRLEFIGSGPDQAWIQAEAAKRGISDRVTCRGQLPREAVLEALSGADAMLFPSLHDSGPWAVAEACAIGLPVICVNLGGPPVLVRETADGVSIVVGIGPGLPARLARALRTIEASPRPAPSDRWGSARIPILLDAWYGKAERRTRNGKGTTTEQAPEVAKLVRPKSP
jgi:glycosyltransferase involved in cell wall biosynthesis